jgi:hypothetical protein
MTLVPIFSMLRSRQEKENEGRKSRTHAVLCTSDEPRRKEAGEKEEKNAARPSVCDIFSFSLFLQVEIMR